jgi:hypothetical protein
LGLPLFFLASLIQKRAKNFEWSGKGGGAKMVAEATDEVIFLPIVNFMLDAVFAGCSSK